MVGRKLVERIAHDGSVGGAPISRLTLVDLVEPPPLGDRVVADLSEPGVAADLLEDRPDLIVHLAAVVSGEAEADLDKGYRVNLEGTRSLFDAFEAPAASTVRGSCSARRSRCSGRRFRRRSATTTASAP